MKKIESITDLTEGQEVYIKVKYKYNEHSINPYVLITSNRSVFAFNYEEIYPLELFTDEQLELPVVGKAYDFSNDGKNWYNGILHRFIMEGTVRVFKFIRPIQQPSEEIIRAIELLKLNGYTKIEK